MKAKLNTFVDIRNGYQFRGRVTPTAAIGNRQAPTSPVVRVIQIKDVDAQRRLHTDDLVPVRLEADPSKYLVQEGDVLFLARGQRLFATAVMEPMRDTVATGYFFILRPKNDKVRSRFLAWYINQEPFQATLKSVVKGTDQPLVARKDIADLPIEIPPLETQQAIVALEDLRIEEQRLLAKLGEKRSKLVQALSVQAAQRTE